MNLPSGYVFAGGGSGSSTAASTGQTYTDAASDQSTTIQALIDTAGTAYAAGDTAGRVVTLPAGVFYGSFKMRPGVILKGQGQWSTILRAMPGQTAAVLDYATYDAFHTKVHDLRVDGNYLNARSDGLTQGNCRGIDVSSSASDAYALPFPATTYSDYTFPQFTSRWDNPANVIQDVAVTGVGGDRGVYIGRNQRLMMVTRMVIENCKQMAMEIAGTDGFFEQISAGVCGDGILISGSANKLVGCKSWYHGVNTGYTTGSGDGYRIDIQQPPSTTIFYAQLTGCESQDNIRYGYALRSSIGSRIAGCISAGDTGGAVYLGASTSFTCADNDVSVNANVADRAQEPTAVVLDATVGVSHNKIRVAQASAGKAGGWVPVTLAGGASVATNDILVTLAEEGSYGGSSNFSGTFSPGLQGARIQHIIATGAVTVGPVSLNGWRDEITLIIQQDATGGRAITFDASIVGCPAASTTANKRNAYRLVNVATTTATPSWQCVAANIGY